MPQRKTEQVVRKPGLSRREFLEVAGVGLVVAACGLEDKEPLNTSTEKVLFTEIPPTLPPEIMPSSSPLPTDKPISTIEPQATAKATESEIPEEIDSVQIRLNLKVQKVDNEYVFSTREVKNKEVFRARKYNMAKQENWEAYWQMERIVDGETNTFELTSSLDDLNLVDEVVVARGLVKNADSAEYGFGKNGWEILPGSVLVFVDDGFSTESAKSRATNFQKEILNIKPQLSILEGWSMDPSNFYYYDIKRRIVDMVSNGAIISVTPKISEIGQISEYPAYYTQNGKQMIPEYSKDGKDKNFSTLPSQEDIVAFLNYSSSGEQSEFNVDMPRIGIVDFDSLEYAKKIWKITNLTSQQVEDLTQDNPLFFVEWKLGENSNLKMLAQRKNFRDSLLGYQPQFTPSELSYEVAISMIGFYLHSYKDNPYNEWADIPWGDYVALQNKTEEELYEEVDKVSGEIAQNPESSWISIRLKSILKTLLDNDDNDIFDIVTWTLPNKSVVSRIIKSNINRYSSLSKTISVDQSRFGYNLKWDTGVLVHEAMHALQSLSSSGNGSEKEHEIPLILNHFITPQFYPASLVAEYIGVQKR